MRLINAKTYALEEFWDEHAEKYAILSHRWEDGEVSLQDIESPTALSVIQKKGLGKIKWSCKQALKDGLQYVWVDTCCIDKKSSAELSEAINSMFRWYKASTVCYGFLSDVDSSSSFRNMERQIRLSKWFTRGWTLQELIAPQDVVFYDQQWKQLGTKHSMRKLLSEVTAIDEEILDGSVPITNYSIAQRMSWIAGRTTTCVEDTAYCLLGIFDVNMPMLYGEGEKAFSRLQQEIIKHSDDQTILAWPINRPNQPSLFADHPQAFASCRYIVAAPAMKGGSPYSLTNRGMSIRLMAAPYTTGIYVARLNCFNLEMSAGGLPPSFRLGIFLKRLNEDDQYARVEQEGRTFVSAEGYTKAFRAGGASKLVEFNIRQHVTELGAGMYEESINGFSIMAAWLFEHRFKVTAPIWDLENGIMAFEPLQGDAMGSIDISEQNRRVKLIKLGFDFEFNPVCFIAWSGGLVASDLSMKDASRLTQEQLAHIPGIKERTPYDELGWSEVDDDEVAKELQHHAGLWALKGDRIVGLRVKFNHGRSYVRIERGHHRNKAIWRAILDL